MFKLSSQLLYGTPSRSVLQDRVCLLVISIHNCAHFSSVLLLLNLQLALSLLAWKVSHTFCQLWCLSQDVLWRAAGCAPSEGVQGTAGRGWAVPGLPGH